MNEPSSNRVQEMQYSRGGLARLARMVVHPAFVGLLLAVATCVVYWPVKSCDFVNYDDGDYYSSNPHVQAGLTRESVAWAFRTTENASWYPLMWLSFMADVVLFGKGASGPHLMNLLLHVANAVLLFILLRRLTGALWRSAFVAALFALHPLHVESVAWISERKDVLSTFFGFLSLIFYVRYAQSKTRNSKLETRNYLLSLFFFGCGLMAKPMLVTWPFVMLLLDCWPLERVSSLKSQVLTTPSNAMSGSRLSTLDLRLVWRLVWEKTPFFALSAAACAVTFWVHRGVGAVTTLENLSLGGRMANAFISYTRYLGKMFWPVDLALPYPHPGRWSVIPVVLAVVLVAGLCGAAAWLGRRRRYVFVGWFWFLGTLIPVIGFIQWGSQSMADRFTYVPLIGLFIVLAWWVGEISARWRQLKVVIVGAAVLSLLACGVRARDQLGCWKDSETLFRHALSVTKENFIAHDCLGMALSVGGPTEEGINHFREAVRINPNADDAHINLGFALAGQGKFEEAIVHYREALRINPRSAEAHLNLGSALQQLGRLNEAQDELTTVLKLNPRFPMAYYNLASIFDQQGRRDEALKNYRQAIRLKPDYAEARSNLACLLAAAGQMDEAETQFREALRLKPDYGEAHANLGAVLRERGRFPEALGHYEQAVRFNPNNAGMRVGLAGILAELGRRQEAIDQLTEALRLNPNNPEAKNLLRALGVQSGT